MSDPVSNDTKLRLRVVFGAGVMIGPGKAELLEHIRDTGSISAAGRAMGMSYKRAWMLVEVMNAAFREPLVASVRGGPQGGGAQLTEAGAQVVAQYRAIEAKARAATVAEVGALRGMLKDMSDGK
jgi:molybdate transport system regulatory protein